MNTESPDSAVKRLRNLIEASHCLATIESVDALLPELVRLAKEVVRAEACSIQLYSPERSALDFAWVDDEILGTRALSVLSRAVSLGMGEGIAGWVAANRRSALIEDVCADERFFHEADQITGFSTRTLLSVPLIHQNELLGVLNALNCKNKRSFDNEDQEILESFADLAAIALVRARLLSAKLKQEKLRVELEAAAQLQALLQPEPADLGHGSHFWAWSEAAGLVGGDLCDLIRLADGSWLVYVADVSGKGLPAAMVMATLWSRIRSESSRHDHICRLLTDVNHAMYDAFSDCGYFATIVLARYWADSGKIEFTCGGHIPPYWVADGALRDVPLVRGVSLGVIEDAAFEREQFVMEEGDSVLFVTDGVTESTDSNRVMFGESQLRREIKRSKAAPYGKELLHAVQLWSGGAGLDDDLTIAELWRDPSSG